MNRSTVRLVAVPWVFLAIGCAAMKERPKLLPFKPYQNSLVNKYSKDDSWYTDYSAQVNAGNLTQAKAIRDQVLYELIWLVDDRYNNFENAFNGGSALTDTASSVTSLAATTTAPITRAPGTKSILAGISTLVTGSDSAFNTNYYQSKTRAAIIAKMRSGRAQVLAQLTAGMSNPVDKYSLAQGLTDIQNYYNAGTVVSALNSIGADAGQQTQKANDSISKVRLGQ